VRLAYIPYSADLPFFVAMDNQMFERRNVQIEPIKCSSTSEALDLVLGGKADGAMGNSFSVLYAVHAKDSNIIRLVNVSVEMREQDRYTGFVLVRSDSDIRTVQDLKGKAVGTGKGASQLVWVQLYFKNMGWDPKKDVFIEQEAPESLLGALQSGQFDAVFAFEPYATVGVQKGIARPLVPFFRENIINPFPAGGAVLSREFLSSRPEDAKAVVDALDQAIELINANPDQAKKSLVTYTPLSKDEAQHSQIYYWWGSHEMKLDPMQRLADILLDANLLASRIDVNAMVQ